MKNAFYRSLGKKILVFALVAIMLVGAVAAAGVSVSENQITLSDLHANTTDVIVAGYAENGQMLFAKVQPASQTTVTADLSETAYLRVFETNAAMQPTKELTTVRLKKTVISTAAELKAALTNGGVYYLRAMDEFYLTEPVTVGDDVTLLVEDSEQLSLSSVSEEYGVQSEQSAVVTFKAALTVAAGKTLSVGEGVELRCGTVVNNGTISAEGVFLYDSVSGSGSIVSENALLTDITVDGYTLNFNPTVTNYMVRIPAGRSEIPEVTTVPAAGVQVSVIQAVIPDSATSGSAVLTAVKGEKTVTYTVKFIRDSAVGFQLQYNDYYSFASGAASLTSSDTSVIEITADKKLHAKKLSSTPVTVTAKNAAGDEIARLVVDEVIEAPIDIFLIVGQSNAYGTYDVPNGQNQNTFYQYQIDNFCIKPQKGTVLCADVHWDGNYYGRSSAANPMYDLSVGRAGFSPALGKTWYDLTGEKTLMIQTAVGGSPIEAWEKPEGGTRNTYADPEKGNYYETTKKALTECRAKLDAAGSGYKVKRIHAYWLQGETGMINTYNPAIAGWNFGDKSGILNAEQYYSKFMKNMEYFENEFGVSFMGVLLVRCVTEAASAESNELQLLTDLVPARAAQYALNNTNGEDLAIVSRVCDIARMASYPDVHVEGYNFMGVNNLHYNQIGHNANGISAAEETYKMLLTSTPAEDVEIIKPNGRDRFADGEELELKPGEQYQTAAMVLPECADTKQVSYEVADESVCTVDKYGMITADSDAAGKSTTVTYSVDGTDIEKTITVKVGRVGKVTVSYEWNFDNNDLTEKDGKNDLTVSTKTGSNASYSINNGFYTATNSLTNFRMEKEIPISADYDFTIEWRTQLTAQSCLFGTADSGNNFMYLAYPVYVDASTPEWNHPLRIVDADGDILTIPYGNYAARNTEYMNTWKLSYNAATGVATFTCNDETVGSTNVPKTFSLTFTNLFGSYISGTDVDLCGSVDYVRITTSYLGLVYD